MSSPIASKRGRARSKSAASPPAMIVSVPSSARGAEPVTGASTSDSPRSARRAPIARDCDGEIVDMSTQSVPGAARSAAPSSPRSIASTWSPSTTIVMTTSAAAAASAGVPATAAPCSAAKASALARVRLKTVSSCPARLTFAAIREPMIPKPMKPTRMARILWRGRRCPGSDREPVAVRDRGCLGARAHVELREDARDVDAGGLLGHVELRADLAVGGAASHELEHLALAGRQPERVAGRRLGLGDVGRRTEGQAAARRQGLHLAQQPAGAEAGGGRVRLARRRGGGLPLAGLRERLGLAEAHERGGGGAVEGDPGFGGRSIRGGVRGPGGACLLGG